VTPYPHTIQSKITFKRILSSKNFKQKEIEAISDYIKYIDNKKENFKKQIKKYKKLI
jgi:hypothetical protein